MEDNELEAASTLLAFVAEAALVADEGQLAGCDGVVVVDATAAGGSHKLNAAADGGLDAEPCSPDAKGHGQGDGSMWAREEAVTGRARRAVRDSKVRGC